MHDLTRASAHALHVCAVAQTLLGLALALCEDGPMAGISIYFFVQRYQIPIFQVRCPCAFIISSLRPAVDGQLISARH